MIKANTYLLIEILIYPAPVTSVLLIKGEAFRLHKIVAATSLGVVLMFCCLRRFVSAKALLH